MSRAGEKRSEDLFEELFRNSPDAILMLRPSGEVVDANAAFEALFGYNIAELRQGSLLTLIQDDPPADDAAHRLLASPNLARPVRLTTTHRDRAQRPLQLDVLAYPLPGGRGTCVHYRDVTEREAAKGEAAYRANHDELTGLLNRSAFERLVLETLEESTRSGQHHSLLYVDLDQFKIINDACGHKAGDQVLVTIGQWLKASVRDSDVVARMAGDEFAVLLVGCAPDIAIRKAQALQTLLAENPYTAADKSYPLSASIGVVPIDSSTPDLASVLIWADAACFSAKEKGRSRTQLYQPDDAELLSRQAEMAWVGRLSKAIEENRFVLLYQEIVGLAPGSLRHRELLIRYREDDGTLIPPGAFIPSAERYNLMPMIDRWVVREACGRLAAQRRAGEAEPGVISVNVSGTSLNDESFMDDVAAMLEDTQIPGEWICFEITETAAIKNLPCAQKFIRKVKQYGCSIALDDFGSGMSSFNYLRTLAVDYLKIDGTFIREMETNHIDSAMTDAINKMGKVLGLKTVAEFVETAELMEKLREMGIDYAQGFGVHKPEMWH